MVCTKTTVNNRCLFTHWFQMGGTRALSQTIQAGYFSFYYQIGPVYLHNELPTNSTHLYVTEIPTKSLLYLNLSYDHDTVHPKEGRSNCVYLRKGMLTPTRNIMCTQWNAIPRALSWHIFKWSEKEMSQLKDDAVTVYQRKYMQTFANAMVWKSAFQWEIYTWGAALDENVRAHSWRIFRCMYMNFYDLIFGNFRSLYAPYEQRLSDIACRNISNWPRGTHFMGWLPIGCA